MSEFIKGLDLCEAFFCQIGKPIIDKHLPHLKYSAALIGYGSDVLGFDTAMSTDHMWGPRFYIFLEEDVHADLSPKLSKLFSEHFPTTFMGYTTHFSLPIETDNGVRVPEKISEGPVSHLIFIHTIKEFFQEYLGWDAVAPLKYSDWLTFPEHRLRAMTAGRVFHDDLGLEGIRQKITFYPDDVWYYLMASQWAGISEEEAFVGRTGNAGDELGSRLIASRLINHIMRLAFLLERQYAPYSKWFGTAFALLPQAKELLPLFQITLEASTWQKRQEALGQAYTYIANAQNSLAVSQVVESDTRNFFNRPFEVIFANRFAEAIKESIQDPTLKAVELFGSVTHFSPESRVYDNPAISHHFKHLYQ